MSDPITFDLEVDASGLNCPLPILRAKKALSTLASGQVLKVIATDPGSKRDFQQFTRQAGHELVGTQEADHRWIFFVKRR